MGEELFCCSGFWGSKPKALSAGSFVKNSSSMNQGRKRGSERIFSCIEAWAKTHLKTYQDLSFSPLGCERENAPKENTRTEKKQSNQQRRQGKVRDS